MGIRKRSELKAPSFTNIDNHLYAVTDSLPCTNYSTQNCVQPFPSNVQLFVDISGDHRPVKFQATDRIFCIVQMLRKIGVRLERTSEIVCDY
jgi:hypothetical protein